MASHPEVCLDCDQGRQMGCATYCCTLLVRMSDEEARQRALEAGASGEEPLKRYIEKDASGYCIHLERESGRCGIWQRRPQVCREYSCNDDVMLQVVLRDGFSSVVKLALAATREFIPRELWRQIPAVGLSPRHEPETAAEPSVVGWARRLSSGAGEGR